jgi:hypothetical protein
VIGIFPEELRKTANRIMVFFTDKWSKKNKNEEGVANYSPTISGGERG